MTDYVLDYCQKVLNGEIIANQKIKLACQREINDRERAEAECGDFNFFLTRNKPTKQLNS